MLEEGKKSRERAQGSQPEATWWPIFMTRFCALHHTMHAS